MNSIIFFVILVAFILITYRNQRLKNFSFKRILTSYKVPVVISLLILIPLIFMNLFFGSKYFHSAQEKMELAEKYKNEVQYQQAFKEYAVENKDNPAVQLEYINFYLRDYTNWYSCGVIQHPYRHKSTNAAVLSLKYANYMCDREALKLESLKKFPDTLVTVNYLKGLYYREKGASEKAVKYFLREIVLHPDFELSYGELILTLSSIDKKQLDELMLIEEFANHIPIDYMTNYYFLEGYWGSYFKMLYLRGFFGVSWLTFLSAFVISFVWLYYLRLMDVFNREKWMHVILVFVLGGLFTNLCLPIYDYFHLKHGFTLTGEAFHDFLYCTLVIGGGEELVKFIPWITFGLLAKKFKEPFDYILYASASALGFAFIENFIYLENFANISTRAMVTSVAHMFFASIIAYAFIIVRYRLPKNSPYKIPVIVLGFLLAMLAHGFYDFWLLSNAVEGYAFVTILFFIFSLHVWFFFKNNAMNHSPFFKGNDLFNVDVQKDVLFISITLVMMLEYVLLSYEFGAKRVNSFFFSEIMYVGMFLIYISLQLNKFKVIKNVWNQFTFSKLIPFEYFGNFFSRISEQGYRSDGGYYDGELYEGEKRYLPEDRDLRGLELRLFAPKSNKYIGAKLPVSGYCSRKISVGGNHNWYLFKLNTPVQYADYVADSIIVKNKKITESLLKPKIAIYFMFIPNPELLNRNSIDISELRYTGRAYSIPLNSEFY